MNPATLAERLNVNADTIRRWSTLYAAFLGPGATPPKGRARSYTDFDARVLLFIATLRESGLELDDIDHRLNDLQRANWIGLPELPPEWGLDEQTVPVGVAVSKAADIARIAVLQAELDNVRRALQDAQSRAETLERDLGAERLEKSTLAGELGAARVEIEKLHGQVSTLEARLGAYSLAYGLGRERPLPLVLVVAVTAILVVVLTVAVILIGTVL